MTSISTLWATLDSTVQQWLLQNPGQMILPRTYVNRVAAGAGRLLSLDQHGEYWLSQKDLLFLKKTRSRFLHPATAQSAKPHSHAAAVSSAELSSNYYESSACETRPAGPSTFGPAGRGPQPHHC